MGDYYVEHFDNITDFLNTCDTREYNKWAHDRRNDDDFWAGDTYDRARDLLQHGCTADVHRITPRSLPHVADVRPKNVSAVVGYMPIVPAAIMNIPQCMIDRKNAPAKNKVIHVLYDVNASASVNKSQMLKQGERVAAFIMSVERAGYRVQLDALATFQHANTNKYAVTLTLKDAARPLDIKRLTYPLLHISMLRQICFDWYERYPNAEYVTGYGLPLYHESREYQRDFVRHVTKDEHTIYITLTTDVDALYEQLASRRG